MPEAAAFNRETLYVWDGIISVDEEKKTDEEFPLEWIGTCVECQDCADAKKAKAPVRNAFKEFVDSDLQFTVNGVAKLVEEGTDGPYTTEMVDGEGWDTTEGPKTKDSVHDVYLGNVKWTGGDAVDSLVFATGKNAHGSFIAAGWMRPGNRVTLGRRYLEENDSRAKWGMTELSASVLEGILQNDGTIRIPPWQCPALHADEAQSHNTKKRKLGE